MSIKWNKKKNGDWSKNDNINFNFDTRIRLGKPHKYKEYNSDNKIVRIITGPWAVDVSVTLEVGDGCFIEDGAVCNVGDFHEAKKWAEHQKMEAIKRIMWGLI